MGQKSPISHRGTATIRYGPRSLKHHFPHSPLATFHHWGWKNLAAWPLWLPLEAGHSSPVQRARAFVNLVSCCTHQPLRLSQQKLLKSLKCKVLHCEISAAASATWRVILFGIARALTVTYFRIMRHQFSVKRLFKNTPNLMGCVDELVHSTQLLPFMLVVGQVVCLLSLRVSPSFQE